MLTHLTIKNENCSNLRTATPEKKGPLLSGDSSWGYDMFVVGKKFGSAGVNNVVKRGLRSRLV